jgi:hypothetical protein
MWGINQLANFGLSISEVLYFSMVLRHSHMVYPPPSPTSYGSKLLLGTCQNLRLTELPLWQMHSLKEVISQWFKVRHPTSHTETVFSLNKSGRQSRKSLWMSKESSQKSSTNGLRVSTMWKFVFTFTFVWNETSASTPKHFSIEAVSYLEAQIIHLSRTFHHKPSILGYPRSRKPPLVNHDNGQLLVSMV